MRRGVKLQRNGGVALRKESVDRNADGAVSGSGDYVSLSARRAWIEILKRMYHKA